MLGTAKYLAPEQVEGRPVDGRSDLYALGVVLYEMVCGRPPFVADTDAAIALARLHRDPEPPSRLRDDLPSWLEQIIVDCLQRDPERRPPSATDLRRRLARRDAAVAPVAEPAPVPPAPPATAPPAPAAPSPAPPAERTHARRGRRRRWPVVVLIGAAAVVAAVLAAGIGLGPDGTDEPIALSRAAAFDPLGSPPGEEHNAEAPLAIDGDAATAWTTETYRDPARLGKPGVGLVVRLDHETSVRTLRVVSGSVNWSASIYTASGEPGADLAAWGDPVAGASGLGPPGASFSLHGTRAAAVLIWITRVGDDGLVRVAEVQAAG
jgi:hypothetical protein